MLLLAISTLTACSGDSPTDDSPQNPADTATSGSPGTATPGPANDDDQQAGTSASLPTGFTASRASFGQGVDVAFDSVLVGGLDSALPLDFSDDGNKLLLSLGASSSSDADHQFVDLSTGNFTSLNLPATARNVIFDREWNTALWANDCIGYVRVLDAMSEAMVLNPLLRQEACVDFNPAGISDDGDVVLLNTTRGRVQADGTIGPGDVLPDADYSSVAVRLSDSSLTSLAANDLTLDTPSLMNLESTVVDATLSADGQYVFAKLFSSQPQAEAGSTGHRLGYLLADTLTGTTQLLGDHGYDTPLAGEGELPNLVGPVISGNGRYAFYQQPLADGSVSEGDPLGLYRYDLTDGTIVSVPSPSPMVDLRVSRDGKRAAWSTSDEFAVAYMDSGRVLPLTDALRACEGDACLYENIEKDQSTRLEMSADGSSLAVTVVVLDNGPNESQFETFHADLDTGVVSHVALASGTHIRAISDDGDTIASIKSGADESGTDYSTLTRVFRLAQP